MTSSTGVLVLWKSRYSTVMY